MVIWTGVIWAACHLGGVEAWHSRYSHSDSFSDTEDCENDEAGIRTVIAFSLHYLLSIAAH